MANILSFEKFAEFQPIEGLLDEMRNARLFGEVRSAVSLIEAATSHIPEDAVETVAPVVKSPISSEVSIDESLLDKNQEQMITGSIDMKKAQQAVEAAYQIHSPEYQVPRDLQGV